jgi:hypothetical protein
MNTNQSTEQNTKTDWATTSSRIQAKFSKLSREHVESLKDNMGQLSQKLQTAYGYPKEQADRESETFKTSLNSSAPRDDRSVENFANQGQTKSQGQQNSSQPSNNSTGTNSGSYGSSMNNQGQSNSNFGSSKST